MRMELDYVARIIAGGAVAVALGVSPAYAIVIKEATLQGGAVTVSGSQAAKSARISWEGVEVVTAGKSGSFTFTTLTVPADCTGSLSDGVSTAEVTIAGCMVTASTLPGTGQTISYAPGDDGAVQAGGALSYTDNGDGTVTDHKTRLTWEKKTTANVNGVYTWYAALDYAAELNAMNGGQGFAGYNDWRLPNVRELQSIVDYSRSAPCIDPVFGPTMGTLNFVDYWTSTSWSPSPQNNAWSVDFAGAGGTGLAFGKVSALRVRVVRGGR
jgi:hypothetical protein